MASDKKRWWRRWPALVGAVVVLAGAGVGIWLGTSSSGPDYSFTTASTGTVEQTVTASGTLEAVNQADVNFQVSGQVASLTATVGEQVTAGETLATLGAASLQASVDEDSANLASDQAKLDEDEDPSSTSSSSSGSGGSGGAGATSAAPSASEIDSDEAQIEAAQSQLDSAEQDLADATLVAPIAGTVVAVNLTVGQSVGSGGSSTAAASSAASSSSTSASTSTPDVEIQDMSSYEVQASISAADVSLVKAGDQTDITPSSSTATVFGTVSSIALVPTVTSGVATFPVVINVTGDPTGLYSGVSANVSIIVLQVSNVLTVPTSAVHTLGGSSFVYELHNGKEVEHTVKVGATGSTETQILSGLKSGTRIVLANRSAAIPSSGTSGSTGFTRFGGGGFGGGGFTGGGGGGFTRIGSAGLGAAGGT